MQKKFSISISFTFIDPFNLDVTFLLKCLLTKSCFFKMVYRYSAPCFGNSTHFHNRPTTHTFRIKRCIKKLIQRHRNNTGYITGIKPKPFFVVYSAIIIFIEIISQLKTEKMRPDKEKCFFDFY